MQKSRSYTMLEDDSDDDDDDDGDELVVDSIVAWLVRSLLPGGTRKPVLGDRWLTGRTGADLGRGGRDGSRRGGREIVVPPGAGRVIRSAGNIDHLKCLKLLVLICSLA